MATKGKSPPKASVTLRGRFPIGARVRLVSSSGPGQLRAGGHNDNLAVKRVGEDGVTFTDQDGVEVGGRYFVVGYVNGHPLEVRVTGREPGDGHAGQALDPVGNAEVRFAGGGVVGLRGGGDQEQVKPAVPAHPDPAGKDFERIDSSPAPASQVHNEFPEERPAVPPHPPVGKRGR